MVATYRYNPVARLTILRDQLRSEAEAVNHLRAAFRDFRPTDKRGWTHYDHAHFMGESKGDIEVAILRGEGRIRDLLLQIKETEREVAREEDDDEDLDLVY